MDPVAGRERLELVRHRNRFGDDRALRRAAFRGEKHRLRSGAYVDSSIWAALSAQDRARLEIAAAHDAARGDCVASHASAAALWRIPRLFTGDGLVHARASVAAGTRTENGFRKHAVADLDLHLTEVQGVPCTTLERTVLDLAMTEPFAAAVVAADWALRLHTTREALQVALDELDPKQGRRRAQGVIDFASPLSGSVGESWTRVQVAEDGFPPPVLQQRFDDRSGLIGYVDFWWPELDRIGEFDGMVKYADPAMLRGRTPAQALADEKRREDRLRASPGNPIVIRWIWDTLVRRGALAALLLASGVPRLR